MKLARLLLTPIITAGLVGLVSGCSSIREQGDMLSHGLSQAYVLGYKDAQGQYRDPTLRVNKADPEYIRGYDDAKAGRSWRSWPPRR